MEGRMADGLITRFTYAYSVLRVPFIHTGENVH